MKQSLDDPQFPQIVYIHRATGIPIHDTWDG